MTTLLVNINNEQEEKVLLAFLNSLKYDYSSLGEGEINHMSLTLAQSSLSHDWDIEDKEENTYWNSFVK
ncbi:MAG TPA: hypothetical protein DCO83_11775 [Mucilaginibacter sp.]|jgi:hypothetical protein|nr:hypothetical protein [Mucilaginibacter sp.]